MTPRAPRLNPGEDTRAKLRYLRTMFRQHLAGAVRVVIVIILLPVH
jgi:hypothetical protein